MNSLTIGQGAIFAAGSIVTKTVALHTLVAGNPARFVCTVEEFTRRKNYNLKTKGYSGQDKMIFLLSLSDNCFVKK